MKKSIIIYLAIIALVFVSCKENASSKIKDSNIETAKARDSKISLGSPIIEFDTKEFVDGIEYGGAATFFEFAGQLDIC